MSGEEDSKFVLYKDLKKVVEEIKSKFYNPGVILNRMYPKGSIVITYENKNPSEYIGGTWEAFGKGQTLMGVDTSQTEFNSVGKTGGGKEAIAKITIGWTSGEGNFLSQKSINRSFTSNINIPNFNTYNSVEKNKVSATEVVSIDKNGTATNNALPPYITVYYWRRVDDAPLVMDFKQLTFNSDQFKEENNVLKIKGWKYEGTLAASVGSKLTLSSDNWTELKIIQCVNESGVYFNQCCSVLKETFALKSGKTYILFNYNSSYYCNVLLRYSNKVLTCDNVRQSSTWVLQDMPVYSKI